MKLTGVWLAAGLSMVADFAPRSPLDKVRFGTNWLAEAEHGGYYQALVDGTYAKYGLDVTIVPGRPAGRTTACCWPPASSISTWAATSSRAFDAVEQHICRSSWSPRISRKTRRC